MPSAGLFVLSRALAGGFLLFTSVFCLLAYVPFTYQQVHKGGLLPWLNGFGRFFPVFYWLIFVVALAAFCLDRPRAAVLPRVGRGLRRLLLMVLVALGVYASVAAPLAHPPNDRSSYVMSLVALVPLFLWAAIDWIETARSVQWASAARIEDAFLFRAAVQSALFLTLIYTAVVYPRVTPLDWNLPAALFAASWSVLSHLLVMLLLFVVLLFLTAVSGWFGRPPLNQFVLCHLLGACVFWLVFRSIVFAGLSFFGPAADFYAAAFSLASAAYLSGAGLRLLQDHSGEVSSGVAAAWWCPEPGARRGSRRRIAAGFVILAAGGAVLAVESARMDWNYLLQKLAALLLWVATFRMFYRRTTAAAARVGKHAATLALLATLGVLAGYRTLQAHQHRIWRQTGNEVTTQQFLDRYSGYDASFRLIRETLAPAQSADPGFYRFLQQHTNIPRAVRIQPVPIELSPKLEPGAGGKPHIFMVVVDSLRRDYLAPFNSRVDFTPAIAEFARESVVFENAFSHYGATGLSEPSIWVGGMMIHQQYVTPFQPMNALEKLLRAESYRSFISRDTILHTVVTPWENLVELDASRATMDYDLCASLTELEQKIATEGASGRPLFAYTQPQNIHISRINREGGKAIDTAGYTGFFAPYASRVRRIDGCFGNFIRYLKARGLYDQSIVMLTADHGDSLGEQGRWGHAYTIYPEIIQIPLIIHLPESMKQTYSVNPKLVTFSTDITPSLYYLLGHRPVLRNELFGRPLFTEQPEEQGPYRQDSYLIASSYGAVYGILSGDGRTLFVSDAVNYKDSIFDLALYTGSGSTVNSSDRAEYQELIRTKLEAVAKFYNYAPR